MIFVVSWWMQYDPNKTTWLTPHTDFTESLNIKWCGCGFRMFLFEIQISGWGDNASVLHGGVLVSIYLTAHEGNGKNYFPKVVLRPYVMWSSKMSPNSQILIWRYSQTKEINPFVFYCFDNLSIGHNFRMACPILMGFSGKRISLNGEYLKVEN